MQVYAHWREQSPRRNFLPRQTEEALQTVRNVGEHITMRRFRELPRETRVFSCKTNVTSSGLLGKSQGSLLAGVFRISARLQQRDLRSKIRERTAERALLQLVSLLR